MFPTIIDHHDHPFTFVDGIPDPYVKGRFYFLGHADRRHFKEANAQELLDAFAATFDGDDALEVIRVDRVTQRTSTAGVQSQARKISSGNTFYAFCVQIRQAVKIPKSDALIEDVN